MRPRSPVKKSDLTTIPLMPRLRDDTTQGTVDRLKEIVQIREGDRFSKLDAFVTWRDLIDLGIVKVKLDDGTVYESGGTNVVGQ